MLEKLIGKLAIVLKITNKAIKKEKLIGLMKIRINPIANKTKISFINIINDTKNTNKT